MLYALLCYGAEDEVAAWSRDHQDAVMSRIAAASDLMNELGKRGPSLRLMPTTTAVTLRPGATATVYDGPSVISREQLLGLWLIDCQSLEDALAAARLLMEARGLDEGALEVRPISMFETPAIKADSVGRNQTLPPGVQFLTLT